MKFIRCHNKIIFLIFFLVITLFSLVWEKELYASKEEHVFKPGESLRFSLKWENIPAGEATLKVLPVEEMNGKKVYHFVMEAKSNKFLDIFFKVRDRIDSYAYTDMTRSLHYKKKQREGSHKRDTVVSFDWEKKKAEYSNHGKKEKTISLLDGSFDPLSAFYFTRLHKMKAKMKIERPVTDGKKNVMGIVKIISRQTITVDGKTYDTYLLEPEMKHIGGIFKEAKDGKIQVWVTADKKHIPVKVKGKAVIGSFTGELISATGIK